MKVYGWERIFHFHFETVCNYNMFMEVIIRWKISHIHKILIIRRVKIFCCYYMIRKNTHFIFFLVLWHSRTEWWETEVATTTKHRILRCFVAVMRWRRHITVHTHHRDKSWWTSDMWCHYFLFFNMLLMTFSCCPLRSIKVKLKPYIWSGFILDYELYNHSNQSHSGSERTLDSSCINKA